jgi:hypothetical protein
MKRRITKERKGGIARQGRGAETVRSKGEKVRNASSRGRGEGSQEATKRKRNEGRIVVVMQKGGKEDR